MTLFYETSVYDRESGSSQIVSGLFAVRNRHDRIKIKDNSYVCQTTSEDKVCNLCFEHICSFELKLLNCCQKLPLKIYVGIFHDEITFSSSDKMVKIFANSKALCGKEAHRVFLL